LSLGNAKTEESKPARYTHGKKKQKEYFMHLSSYGQAQEYSATPKFCITCNSKNEASPGNLNVYHVSQSIKHDLKFTIYPTNNMEQSPQ
jgi:hypothetical protein